jgi:hypothetical protein
MNYADLMEQQRRRLVWISDAIVDDNPLWLLRLSSVRMEDVFPLHAQLKGLFTTGPVYYEQVFNVLREHNLLSLIEVPEALCTGL